MKNISAAFKAHLAQEITAIATCWRATLRDGAIFAFTDHTRDIEFQSILYQSSTGYVPSAVEASSMLNIDNLEIEAILNSETISEKDLAAGRWDYAQIQVMLVNYEDPSMGGMILKTGTLGQVTMKQTSFVAEVRGLTQAYTHVVGELYTPMCRASFGDSRCKMNLATGVAYYGDTSYPITNNGVIQGVSADARFIYDSARTEPGPGGGIAISNISRAKEAVVTTAGAHGFGTGDSIFITGVNGVVQSGQPDPNQNNEWQYGSNKSINGYTYVIDNVTATTFTIPVDTRMGSTNSTDGPAYSDVYSDYISGGAAIPAGNTGFFDYGVVTFGGVSLNAGLSMEVKTYIPGIIELQLPFPYPVSIGDPYTIVAGCGKRFIQDCKNKNRNVVNFRGEPHLPGLDKVLAVGSHPQQWPTTGGTTGGTNTGTGG